MKKVSLKICGITNSKSVKTAYKNKIKSLGFASNNLNGPNTANDKKPDDPLNWALKQVNTVPDFLRREVFLGR